MSVTLPRWLLVWGFAVLLGLAALAGWALVARHLTPMASPRHVPWPLLAAGFALGNSCVVRLEFGREGHLVNLADAVLVPAIVFAGPSRAILAGIVGTLATSVWARRSMVKATFNLCAHALTVTVAVICFHLIIGTATTLSVRALVAAVVAVLAASVVSDVAIQIVIALSTGRFAGSKAGELAIPVLAMVGLNSALGLAATVMIMASPLEGGVLFALIGAAVGAGYTLYGRLQVRHANLQQLYRFNQALAGVVDVDQVVRGVLEEARLLLNAGQAELVVMGPLGTMCHALGEGDDVPRVTRIHGHPVADLVVPGSPGLVAPRGTTDPGQIEALAACGFDDAAAVRLPGDDEVVEVLIVADRRGDRLTFGPPDLTMLDALASQGSIALRSADLHAVKDHQASHDALTGLANRTLFAKVLDEAVDQRTEASLVGVLLMDLDGFKEVNDTLGHDIGDQVLQGVALRLRRALGGHCVIARLGGDEFAVAVPRATSVTEIMEVANRLSLAVQAPIPVGDTAVDMRASIGVTVAPLHGEDRSTLMRRADMTMYRAKRHGGGVAIHDDHQDRASVGHFSMVAELRQAIRASALTLGYQPITDMASGSVTAVEALVRWNHEVYGPVDPEQFIPVAERSGLIGPLTHWVIDTALGQLVDWRRHIGTTLNLSINLSPTMLDDRDIVDHILRLLDHHGVAPGSLTVEITESSLGPAAGSERHVVEHLVSAGVRLAIDDYGTGSSSLTRLKDLPVSELKIDKSFITDLANDAAADVIVGSSINLAHRLGVTVVAEGVETHEAWRRLRQLDCDAAQGYLVAPALTGEAFPEWLRTMIPVSVDDSNIIRLPSLPELPDHRRAKEDRAVQPTAGGD